MDEHRQSESRAGVPDRIELRIVDLQPRAIGLARRQAESLADLTDTNRARGDIRLELRDRLLRPPRSDVAEIDAGEDADAILERRGVDCGHRPLDSLTGHVV